MSGNVVGIMPPKFFRIPSVCLTLGVVLLGGRASAQDTLTLDEALRLAAQRNGTIKSAFLDIRSAHARVDELRSAYLPSITGTYGYNRSRTLTQTSLGDSILNVDGSSTQVTASWRILDSGEREYSLLSGRRSEDATKLESLQTLRSTLFTVHQQFYDALRASELERISEKQVERTQKIYDQTEFGSRPDIGAFPKKDVLQAKADLLNSKVDLLTSKNQAATNNAVLKATIGWDSNRDLPTLEKVPEPTEFPAPPPRDQVIRDGLLDRPDLQARRRRVEAQKYNAKLADREAGLTFGLDVNFSHNFSPNQNDDRNLSLLATYPIFDGGRLRAVARQEHFALDSLRVLLTQAEREAQAEIESAYTDLVLNGERVAAAKAALDAATENYNAAVASQKEGVNDVIAVLTAQVSLVTAESNYVEATYDYYVSDVNLKLVTGKPIPGENIK